MKIIETYIDPMGSDKYVFTQGYLGQQIGEGDYAVYSGRDGQDDDEIARHGDKVSVKEAMMYFPDQIKTTADYRR